MEEVFLSERQLTITRLHGIISQKIELFRIYKISLVLDTI
jgi:hypothetical protein